MIRGLWDGIDSVRAWIGSKIDGFMNGIIGGVQKFFGIKSPSKLFADEVGQWIPAGLAEGIEDNVKPVTDAMNDLTDLTTGAMTSELAMTGSMSMSNSSVAREDTTLGRLEQLFDNLTNQQQVIVLDTGELVGATYPQYDRVGGSQTQLTERWGR